MRYLVEKAHKKIVEAQEKTPTFVKPLIQTTKRRLVDFC